MSDMTAQRAAFEAAYKACRFITPTWDNDHYMFHTEQTAWEIWQAARAIPLAAAESAIPSRPWAKEAEMVEGWQQAAAEPAAKGMLDSFLAAADEAGVTHLAGLASLFAAPDRAPSAPDCFDPERDHEAGVEKLMASAPSTQPEPTEGIPTFRWSKEADMTESWQKAQASDCAPSTDSATPFDPKRPAETGISQCAPSAAEIAAAIEQSRTDSATERDAAVTELLAAVGKLIKAKGRFHTEQNYTALATAYGRAIAAMKGEA